MEVKSIVLVDKDAEDAEDDADTEVDGLSDADVDKLSNADVDGL